MLKRLLKSLVKKWGAKKLLFYVLETCVKATKSKQDDKMLEEVKMFLEAYEDE
tara:strand:+ start:1541 stop:1699 length:159 start_codon:yes stop_codon:yes gene_type:complete